MAPDDVLHFLPRPGDPARHLARSLHPLVEREAVVLGVAVLPLDPRPIDAATVHTRGRAGLEARYCKSNISNGLRHLDGGLITGPAGRNLRGGAKVDSPAQECARRDDYAPRREAPSVARLDAGGATAGEDQICDHPLGQLESGELLEEVADGPAVQRTVALRAWRPDGRALRPVEHPKLDRGAVGGAAHEAAEGIHLADQGTLGDAADGGVAGHLADGIQDGRDEQRAGAEAGGHGGRLGAGVTAAHDDYIVVHRHEDKTTETG